MRLVVAAAAVTLTGAACLPVQGAIPLDHPLFPTGLAATADGAHLIVVSSDFDLAFSDPDTGAGEGALLSGDLDVVRAGGDVVKDAYTSAVRIPALGDKPVFSPHGDRVFVPTRGANLVVAVDVDPDSGALSCDTPTPGVCAGSPSALQLSKNDPFSVLMLDERGGAGGNNRVTGLVTLLSSPEITLFSDDKTREGARRMRVDGVIDLGSSVGGVRAAVLRPATAGTEPVVIAAVDLSFDAGLIGAKLLVFTPDVDTNVVSFDTTATTGALALRDIELVPGEDGDNDAVIAVLRGPDGVARFEIDDAGSLPTLRMTALSATCHEPTSLAYAAAVDRVLLTCQTGDTVQALDPLTLDVTDAVRFEGRGPYDVVVTAANDGAGGVSVPEAYVSFFEDNSVGQLALADAAGTPKLAFLRRIGAQSPKPEDGRQ